MQAQQKPQGVLPRGHDGGANVAFGTSLECAIAAWSVEIHCAHLRYPSTHAVEA